MIQISSIPIQFFSNNNLNIGEKNWKK